MEGHKPHVLENFPVYIDSMNSFIHYTCNSPNAEVLKKYGIKLRGNEFGCKDSREVLEIPLNVYKNAGFVNSSNKDVLNINLEKLIRNLK